MSSIKRSGTIGSGLLLTAAMGLPLLGQDSYVVPPEPVAPSQGTLAPIADPMTETTLPSNNFVPTLPDCPPRPPGHFSRFMQHCRAKYWGYPEEFTTPPLGTSLNMIRATQVANGQAARMVFYQFDFLPESEQLNARGKAKLAQIEMWLTTNTFPIFVEPATTNPDLNELRRLMVWNELSSHHCFIGDERVIVGRPSLHQLDGVDALLIERNRLGLTLGRGGSSGGSATATSSSTGAGSGSMGSGSTGR